MVVSTWETYGKNMMNMKTLSFREERFVEEVNDNDRDVRIVELVMKTDWRLEIGDQSDLFLDCMETMAGAGSSCCLLLESFEKIFDMRKIFCSNDVKNLKKM